MSIFRQTAALLLKEHKHHPISGDVLLIGRQTVLLSEQEALRLITEEGLEPRADFLREIDAETVGSDVGPYITDRAFFSMFCDARVRALDVSDYESAEVVHDLNKPLPETYHGIADFIFNGSCLDNLFDPATAIKSLSKMLKPGGRIIHLEHGSPIQDAYLCYSPSWFFDFYAINNYSDCQMFVCTFPFGLQHDWYVSSWPPYEKEKANGASLGVGDFVNVVIAQKGDAATDDLTPIQSHYRALQLDASERIYQRKSKQFNKNGRDYARMPFQLRGIPLPPPLPLWRRTGYAGLNRLEAILPHAAYAAAKRIVLIRDARNKRNLDVRHKRNQSDEFSV